MSQIQGILRRMEREVDLLTDPTPIEVAVAVGKLTVLIELALDLYDKEQRERHVRTNGSEGH